MLLKAVPQSLENVVELYYRCKLCSAAEAYLDLEQFVEHIEQDHPSYCQPSLPTASVGKVIFLVAFSVLLYVLCVVVSN